MKIIRERKHRLPKEYYIGEKLIFFTACVLDKKDLFIDDSIFNVFEQFLLNTLKEFHCESIVHLFMPDHAHIFLMGLCKDSNIKACMDMFKQRTGFWLKQNTNGIKWQKDYYDRIIRTEEEKDILINYILMNPVRKQVMQDWKEYKYKGQQY